MPANSTHPDYDLHLPAWLRARDVVAGEDAVKAAAERYLPKLQDQASEEYLAYKQRAAFFNATARTTEGFLGLVFRRRPTVKVPEGGGPSSEFRVPSSESGGGDGAHGVTRPTAGTGRRAEDGRGWMEDGRGAHGGPSRTGSEPVTGLGRALAEFVADADLQGTTLDNYAKEVVGEVLTVGRAGTLVDLEGDAVTIKRRQPPLPPPPVARRPARFRPGARANPSCDGLRSQPELKGCGLGNPLEAHRNRR